MENNSFKQQVILNKTPRHTLVFYVYKLMPLLCIVNFFHINLLDNYILLLHS